MSRYAIPLSVSEVDAWARTVWGEARNQGVDGMAAVAWVILNRAQAHHQGAQTITQVCHAPLQFSCWNLDDPNRKLLDAVDFNDPQFLDAFAICLSILEGHVPDPTGGARWYHTVATPAWAKDWPPAWVIPGDPGVVIGDHVFYARAR
jgi:spore germination cell wall hydrolase CwlJ-like protein